MAIEPTESTPRATSEPGTQGTSTTPAPLAERAKNILVEPKAEWPRIDAERSSIGDIYKSYVLILAAIPPVAMALGFLLLGAGYFGVSYIVGLAVVHYVLSLISVYVLALIIEALAPSFGGSKDRLKAFKVAAYASTAAWLAGIAFIIPVLGLIIGIIGGLYSLYLLFMGLPVLMKVSGDKAVPYAVAVIVAAIVLWFLVSMIASSIVTSLFAPSLVTLNLPG